MDAMAPWTRTLSALRHMVKSEAGLLLRYDQQDFIEVRLRETAQRFGHRSVHELVDRAANAREPQVTRAVVEALTTHTTSFFREEHHFRTLIDLGVRDRPPSYDQFRVWSAACSTGQEPYSVAMVLDRAARKRPGFDYRILATDVSRRVLEQAATGVFATSDIAHVPAVLRSSFFEPSGRGRFRVVPSQRARVHFAPLNLAEPPYRVTKGLDAIFCRNVLIYFDDETKRRVVNGLIDRLNPGGLLFLGHAEGVRPDSRLELVGPTSYRRKEN